MMYDFVQWAFDADGPELSSTCLETSNMEAVFQN